MDDSDRAVTTSPVIPAKAGIQPRWFGLAVLASLLVLVGAGCAKSFVTTPVATSTNIVQAPPVDRIENYLNPVIGSEHCYFIRPDFLKNVKGASIVWGGDFSFVSDSFVSSFDTLIEDSTSSTDIGWTGVICADVDQKIVYFTISADAKGAKMFFPVGNPGGSVGSGEMIGFWKRDGLGSNSNKIVVSDVISLNGFQEVPGFSEITLEKMERGYVVSQHINGLAPMGEWVDGWPKKTGNWNADVVFYPETNKLELVKYQPPTEIK